MWESTPQCSDEYSLKLIQWENATQIEVSNSTESLLLHIRCIAQNIFAFSDDRKIFVLVSSGELEAKWIKSWEIQKIRNQVGDILHANSILDQMNNRPHRWFYTYQDELKLLDDMRKPGKNTEKMIKMLWIRPHKIRF